MAKRTPVTNTQPGATGDVGGTGTPGTPGGRLPSHDGPGIGMGAFDDAAHPGGEGGENGDGVSGGEEAQSYAHHPQPHPQPHTQSAPLPQWPLHGGPASFHGWIHPATDSKGHESRIPLRVQPAIGRQIGIVIGSKRFPYRTPQELIRHAVYEHLRWLESIDGTVPSVMGVVDSINALLLDEQMLQEQADILGRHLAVVERHLQMGAYNSAHRVCAIAFALLDRLPPGEWRDSYRLRFSQMYATAQGGTQNPPAIAGPGAGAGAPLDHNPHTRSRRGPGGATPPTHAPTHYDEGGTDDE